MRTTGRRASTAMRAAAAVLAGAAVAMAPAVAVAADKADGEASISYVEAEDGTLQVLVTVPPGSEVDLDGVTVTVDGAEAEATAEPAGEAEVQRTTILTIDTSQSMQGTRFDAAKSAALTFLQTVPDDVEVGIVSFAGEVTEELAPTTDRDAARDVVFQLELTKQTRLYDGLLAGIEAAGSEGQRTMLVLSDGADTSDTELAEVESTLAESGVLLDVVALDQSGKARAALQRLTDAGNGQVIDADAGALAAAFDRKAADLASQILVTAEVPDSITTAEATLAVTLPTASGTLTAEAFAEVGAAPPPEGTLEESGGVLDNLVPGAIWLYVGLGALGFGLLAMLALLVPLPVRKLSPAERAALYTDKVSGRTPTHVGGLAEQEQALDQAKKQVEKVLKHSTSLETKIMNRLEGAGSALKPAEWLLLHIGVFIAAGTLGILLGGGSLITGVLFMIFGAIGPWLYLGFRRSRRRKKFESALPDTLQLMSGSLAAGLSLAQSVDTIVREGGEPVSSEFKRVLIETRLGVSLEDALEGLAERFESKDFAWVVMAIKIQRQVGGNLAELLDTVAATMREREYMRRQVAALAAEGKLSAYVLAGLPPAFMLYLLAAKRDYVMVMFTDPLGWMMLGGAAVMLGVGGFWMSRLVKVEV
ncbi:type II secretion system F family protein [Nocardioides sp. GCM10027113]|uniref:type II secretion system F family protein n=1 Tax=unclassified Nocardioides TaxID=2615069 RepID=UPI003612E267